MSMFESISERFVLLVIINKMIFKWYMLVNVHDCVILE